MSEPPPSKPASGLAGYLIGRMLDYMQTPWKALVIVVLILLGGFGVAIWAERALIVTWLKTPATASLNLGAVPGAVGDLLRETTADIVSLWRIDLQANSQFYVATRQRAGAWDFTPRRLPLFNETQPGAEIVKFLRGDILCDDPSQRGSLLMQYFTAAGIALVCVVEIPPAPDLGLGILYLAWRSAPSPANREAALSAALETATAIVSR